ncbi:hypothetical protein BC832DRAFT_595845 [Gaertneriomyces semiglobifer]|nr:hypothetical protein BC832DRAFT_595845 [Gaertneriomyces semiglobifer]
MNVRLARSVSRCICKSSLRSAARTKHARHSHSNAPSFSDFAQLLASTRPCPRSSKAPVAQSDPSTTTSLSSVAALQELVSFTPVDDTLPISETHYIPGKYRQIVAKEERQRARQEAEKASDPFRVSSIKKPTSSTKSFPAELKVLKSHAVDRRTDAVETSTTTTTTTATKKPSRLAHRAVVVLRDIFDAPSPPLPSSSIEILSAHPSTTQNALMIFYRPLPDSPLPPPVIQEKLDRITLVLRNKLARELRRPRFPSITFKRDTTVERQQHMDDLFDRMQRELAEHDVSLPRD